MSRWSDSFHAHPVHRSLQQLDDWLRAREDDHTDGATAEIRRARKVIESFKSALNKVDPEITPIPLLDSLNAQLDERYLRQYMNAFSVSGALADIQATNDHFTTALQSLTWLLPYSKRSGYLQHTKVLEQVIDNAVTNIEVKQRDISEFLTSLGNKATELSALQERLEHSIETRRHEIDQQVSIWQQQFSDSQEKRLEAYTVWKERVETDLKAKSDLLLDKTKNELLTFESEAEQALKNILDDSEAKHQNIIQLYQLSSGNSIAGGYAQSAAVEDKAANTWRRVSIGFIALTVVWLAFAYCQIAGNFAKDPISIDAAIGNAALSYQEPFSWQRFLVSISLTGVLLIGAGYASQQSNRHREEAKASRRFALQIKALDPFIHSLETEDQAELKKSLTPIFFAGYETKDQKDEAITEKGVSIISTAICDVIKAAKGN